MERSESRTALVTGGAQRVGRAVVERLAKAGWKVAFTYFSSKTAADALQSDQVIGVLVDLGALPKFETNLKKAVDQLGRLDLLMNNASVYKPDPDVPDAQFFKDIFTVNVQAPMQLMEWFAPQLRQSRGHIVNMLDILAERSWPAYKTYCASKAALWNLTLSQAKALAPDVTVNGIAPGVVEWPKDYPQSEREKYLRRVPLARQGTPQDVAELVHFLATEGSYITGQVIRLDGGRSIT